VDTGQATAADIWKHLISPAAKTCPIVGLGWPPIRGLSDIQFGTSPPLFDARLCEEQSLLTPLCHGAFPAPCTNFTFGVPEPLLSSRSRHWDGIVVELRRARNLDAVLPCPNHIISVVLAGVVNLRLGRNGWTSHNTLRSGDVIITSAGGPTRWQHEEEAVGIVLQLAPTYVDKVAAEDCAVDVGLPKIQDNVGNRDRCIEEIAKRLLAGLESDRAASRLYIESLTRQLALHLLKHYCVPEVSCWHAPPRLSHRKLLHAIDLIETNLSQDLSHSQLAAAVAMSPSHFAHAFRQATGLPPHRYVLNRRIERAKSLLRHTDLPISEIALHVGCCSHSNFTALFHMATGVAPRDYRSNS
jgi:AraC family transcriptional regulator